MLLRTFTVFKRWSWCQHVYHMRLSTRLQHNDATNRVSVSDPANIRDDNLEIRTRQVDSSADHLYQRYLMRPDQPEDARILRVAILGAPNSGKSTLVNTLSKWQINSVSSKVHTTLENTDTVLTEGNTQIVFVDTPGVITKLERRKHFMPLKVLSQPMESLENADLIGVIVDGTNKWTRDKLHPELLKLLHLYNHVPSVLIINKIDDVKNKSVLFNTMLRLTKGIVNGKELKRKPLKPEPKSGTADVDFEKLEQKYGAIKTKNKNLNTDRKSKDLSTDLESTNNENLTKGNKLNKDTRVVKNKLPKRTLEEALERIQDQTYQSDYLKSVLSIRHAGMSSRSAQQAGSRWINELDADRRWIEEWESMSTEEDEAERRAWIDRVKDAEEAAKEDSGWKHFERVFGISALYLDGVEELKDYLYVRAQPGDWMYHSSLVCRQHPKDIVKMCIRQSLLDRIPGKFPYTADVEVTHWYLDSNNSLNIAVDIQVPTPRLMQAIVGQKGSVIRDISANSRQAIMNAFQCNVLLKTEITVQKTRSKRQKDDL